MKCLFYVRNMRYEIDAIIRRLEGTALWCHVVTT